MSSEFISGGVDHHLWRSMLIAEVPHALCAKDTNGRFVLVNPRFTRTFGVSPDRILEKTDYDVFPKDIADIHRRRDRAVIDSQDQIEWKETILFPDGPRSFLWRAFPCLDANNRLCGVGAVSLEVSALQGLWHNPSGLRERGDGIPAFRLSEELHWAILSSLKSEIAVIDPSGVIVAVNQSWTRFAQENGVVDLWRVSPGVNYLEVCRRSMGAAPEAEMALDGIEQVLARKMNEFTLEYPCHSPTVQRWFELSATQFEQDSGGAVVCHSNITARVQMEQELKRSEEYHRALMDNTLDVVSIVRDDGTLAYVNQALRRNLGYSPEELLGRNVLDYVHPEDLALVREAIERAVGHPGKPQRIEYRNRHLEGGWRCIESIGISLLDNPALGGIVVSSRDNTARRAAEEALREKDAALERTNEKLQTLAAHILSVEEEERRRISRELHDDLNQRLAVLAVDVGACVRQTPTIASEDLQAKLRSIQQAIADVSESVRLMAHRLHPAVLDDLGIAVALRSYCQEFARRHGVRVRFVQDHVPQLGSEIRTGIYRIAQEALWNIAKHAHTKRAVVAVTAGPHCVRLRVRDWGVGFHPDTPGARRGLGLISMEERARMLGGSFAISSEPGKGARITVDVPLKRETE
jgi:PAS domain S-box-containing protein